MNIKSEHNLKVILDELCENAPSHYLEVAKSLIESINMAGRTLIAGWDTAATFMPGGGKLIISSEEVLKITDYHDRPYMIARVAKKDSQNIPNAHLLIGYHDIDIASLALDSSPLIPSVSQFHEFRKLLAVLCHLRAESSSFFYTFMEERVRWMSSTAKYCDLEEDHVSKLVLWYSAIEEFVE